jgi:hypothetical protein
LIITVHALQSVGQDSADEADQGIAVGEDAGDVGAAADLAVQPLLRVADQVCRQSSLGKLLNASTSARAASSYSATLGSLPATASTSRSGYSRPEQLPPPGGSSRQVRAC